MNKTDRDNRPGDLTPPEATYKPDINPPQSKRQVSLYDYMVDEKDLSEEQIEGIVAIFGHGCREATKDKLWRRLRSISLLPRHGIYSRIILEGKHGIDYITGQDYISERKTVRELLIKG